MAFSYAVIYEQNQKDFTLLVVLRSSGLGTSDKIVMSCKMTHINELALTALSAIRTHHITVTRRHAVTNLSRRVPPRVFYINVSVKTIMKSHNG